MSILKAAYSLRFRIAIFVVLVGGVGGSAAAQSGPPVDVDAGLRKLVELAKTGQNPTVETPTEIEGDWLGHCRNVYGTFNGKTARSVSVLFIFRGNSFYRQADYYPEAECRYSGAGTLAANRVAADIAAGWFAHGAGGLKSIDMLAAPNFGNVYMLNVYQVKGSGADAVLLMGDVELNNNRRPTTATVEYRHFDAATFALSCHFCPKN